MLAPSRLALSSSPATPATSATNPAILIRLSAAARRTPMGRWLMLARVDAIFELVLAIA
jgi:hypothetical protein